MQLLALFALLVLPSASFAQNGPGALRSLSGRDLSFLLKRDANPITLLRPIQRKRGSVPLTLREVDVPIRRGILVARQECSDPTLQVCPGGVFCCEPGGDCCGADGCCPAGNVCFTSGGETGCCPVGEVCDGISGCVDPTQVECPGENFCCEPGTTCNRDVNGVAECLPGAPSDDETTTDETTTDETTTRDNFPPPANEQTTTTTRTTSSRTRTSSTPTTENGNDPRATGSDGNRLSISAAISGVLVLFGIVML